MKKSVFQKPLFWPFAISFIYWAYLFLTARMIIDCDAIGFESMGKILAEKGWAQYFSSGPNREPLYPLLISFSMNIGKLFSVSYQAIQTLLQFLILFITQLITLRILRLLNIDNRINAPTILYLGISPALVNSALSLYSEIATYPLILAAILVMRESWASFSGPKRKVLILAACCSVILILITLTKSIFETIAAAIIILFFLSTAFTRNRRFILNALAYTAVVLGTFYLAVSGYKTLNWLSNGNFAITDNRGAVMFYGSAARRVEPLSRERFLAAIATIPGEGVCNDIFGAEDCSFWSFRKMDAFGHDRERELEKSGLTPSQIEKTITREAVGKIRQNPGQYTMLWLMEGLKMFFWESTQIGFVYYPPALTKFFRFSAVKNGLRLIMSLLTFIALVLLLVFLLKDRRNIFLPQERNKIFLFLSMALIILLSGLYAVCLIVPRYMFPLAPLYLIICAFVVQKTVLMKNR